MKFFPSILAILGLCVAHTHGAQDIFMSEGDVNIYDYLRNLQNLQQSAEEVPQSTLNAETLTPDDVAQMESLLADYYAQQLETDLKSSLTTGSDEVGAQHLSDSFNDAAKETLLELAHKSSEELLAEVLQLSHELGIDISQEEAIETATLLKSIIDTQVSLLSSTDETESANLLNSLMDMYAQLEDAEAEEARPDNGMYLDVDEVQMAIDSLQQLLDVASQGNVDSHTHTPTHTHTHTHTQDSEDLHTQQNADDTDTREKVYSAGRETLQKLSRRSMKKHAFTPQLQVEPSTPNMFVDDSEVLPAAITML